MSVDSSMKHPDGKLNAWTDPNQNAVSFTYQNDLLQSVGTGTGRSLTFGYSGNRLAQVTDDSSRMATA